MDQFTEDELGLNMMANPNRMSSDMDDISSPQVNMNQPLFNNVDESISGLVRIGNGDI